MKKLNKALLGVTALVMAFSVSAMAACGGNGDEGGNPNDPNSEQAFKSSDVKKAVEAFGQQHFKAISVEYSADMIINTASYDCDKDGKKLADATENNYSYSLLSTSTEKMNLRTFEMDDIAHSISKDLDEDGKIVEDSERERYNYNFIRDGYSYDLYSQTEITDFSKAEFEEPWAIDMPAEVLAILAAMPEEGVPADLMTPVTAIMRLADIYDGASYANKKLTVNFNKVAYQLYTEVLTVIEGLNEDTTVGELIGKTPVKNLLQSFTYGIDAKEIYDEVYDMFAGEGSDPAMKAQIDKLPVPEEKEGVYSYLVKLLESKDVAELLFSMAAPGMPASAIAPIAQFTVIDIVTMFMGGAGEGEVSLQMEAAAPTMAQIKAMVKQMLNQYVTVTQDKVTVTMPDEKVEVSALEIVFEVGDDYSVSSVSLSADVVMESSSVHGVHTDGNDYYSRYDIARNMAFSASVEFSKDEYTLKTINTSTAK